MVEDWLALIGNMNGAVREPAAGRAGNNEDFFRHDPRGAWWRSARRQDQGAGGARDCRRHPLRALHPLPRRGRGQAGRLARGSGRDPGDGGVYGRRPLCDVLRPGPGGGRSNRGEGSQACVTAAANGRPQLPSRTRITGSCSLKIAVRQETHGVFSRSQRGDAELSPCEGAALRIDHNNARIGPKIWSGALLKASGCVVRLS